jgi:hypothetical protein
MYSSCAKMSILTWYVSSSSLLLLTRLPGQDAETLPHERERGVDSRQDTAHDHYELTRRTISAPIVSGLYGSSARFADFATSLTRVTSFCHPHVFPVEWQALYPSRRAG